MANAPEYDCVRKLLCPLGDAAISAIKSLINALIAQIELQLLALEAALAPLDIAARTAEAVFKFVEATLQEVLSYAEMIPPIPGSCPFMGGVGLDLRESVEDLTEEVTEAKQKWLRKLSLKQFYADEIEKLEEKKENFQDFMDNLSCAELTT